MTITEKRVSLRIEPETATEGAFLKVLCNPQDVEDVREEMNAHRWPTAPTRREITTEAFWTSRLDYNLEKVEHIDIVNYREKPKPVESTLSGGASNG